MKRVLPFVAAIALLGAVSCKKEYTCDCTTTDSSGVFSPSTVSSTATLSKSDAEDWCSESSTTSGSFTTTCTLN